MKMWRMQDGDRVLTEAEWNLFRVGLELLRDSIEEDIHAGTDNAQTGIAVFDQLTPEQKLALVADTALALRDSSTPMPDHTAANEGAIAAVFAMIRCALEMELEMARMEVEQRTEIRRMLRTVCEKSEEREDPLPGEATMDADEWELLMEEFECRILWDTDFAMGDAFLDLPPDEARAKLQLYGIDADYYLAVPDEPDKAGLSATRQTLARLLDLPMPEDGLL
jgi:hypothetical protein